MLFGTKLRLLIELLIRLTCTIDMVSQIVFNIVASVKFNERFRDAVEINVLGTKKILDLVMETKHLKVSFIDIKRHFIFIAIQSISL